MRAMVGGPYLLLYIKDVQVQENIKGFHTGILNMKQFHLSRHVPRSCSCCPPQVRRRNSDPIDHWSTHRCPMVELLRVRVDRFMMFHVVTKRKKHGVFFNTSLCRIHPSRQIQLQQTQVSRCSCKQCPISISLPKRDEEALLHTDLWVARLA